MLLRAWQWIGWLAYLAGCLLILENSVADYRPGGSGIFISQKGEIGHDPFWRASLYAHIAGGLLCLFSALAQFSRSLLHHFPAIHRKAGRVYVLSVLLLLCPTGFHLGLYAKGGLLGKLGFLTLAVASFHTTLAAWRAVMPPERNLPAHRVWMIRSFALAASAISFRVFHLIGYATGLSEATNYISSLWLSIFANAAAAEWIISQKQPSTRNSELQTES